MLMTNRRIASNGFIALALALALALTTILGLAVVATKVDLDNLPTGKLDTVTTQELFASFLTKFNKHYDTNDIPHRLEIFRENVQWMIDFNAKKDNTHIVGINQFADLRPEEWTQFTGLRTPAGYTLPDFDFYDQLPDEENSELQEIINHPNVSADPAKWDWTVEERDDSGKVLHPKAVLPVRNQQSCGSCYSYSAMAAMEGLYRITYPDAKTWDYFSVQQGIDCTGARYGCSGCGGGWMTSVFRYIRDNNGVCLDRNYPYQNRVGSCRAAQCRSAFVNSGHRDISGHSEGTLIKHLAVNPLSIAVTSGVREFMYYRGGVLTYCGNAYQPDHAVTAVSFDTTAQIPWVRIRNSWGGNWGEAGNIRVALGANLCRWRTNVSYPLAQTGPRNDELPPTFTEEYSTIEDSTTTEF